MSHSEGLGVCVKVLVSMCERVRVSAKRAWCLLTKVLVSPCEGFGVSGRRVLCLMVKGLGSEGEWCGVFAWTAWAFVLSKVSCTIPSNMSRH